MYERDEHGKWFPWFCSDIFLQLKSPKWKEYDKLIKKKNNFMKIVRGQLQHSLRWVAYAIFANLPHVKFGFILLDSPVRCCVAASILVCKRKHFERWRSTLVNSNKVNNYTHFKWKLMFSVWQLSSLANAYILRACSKCENMYQLISFESVNLPGRTISVILLCCKKNFAPNYICYGAFSLFSQLNDEIWAADGNNFTLCNTISSFIHHTLHSLCVCILV